MNLKTIRLLFLSIAAVLLVACDGPGTAIERTIFGAPTSTPDIEAIVGARVKEHLAAIPTPTARVVEKEVIVEKIVVVTATPTPMPTATPTPTPAPTPMPTATPTSTPTPTVTPLDAFDGTIRVTSQTGVMGHEVKWSLINNSKQDVTLVKAEIHNDSGIRVGGMVFGEYLLAAGRDKVLSTSFTTIPEEQAMTYQFVWTFRMHTGETIVCTFSVTNPKSCLRSLID
jgi:hypothetical protein